MVEASNMEVQYQTTHIWVEKDGSGQYLVSSFCWGTYGISIKNG